LRRKNILPKIGGSFFPVVERMFWWGGNSLEPKTWRCSNSLTSSLKSEAMEQRGKLC